MQRETSTDKPADRAPDVRQYWGVVVRRVWVIYTVAGIVLALTALRTFTRPPIYRAESLLEIQRLAPDVLAFRDMLRADNSWQGYNAFYETQYQILQSRNVARQVAERLDLAHHPLLPESRPGLITRGLGALRSLLPSRSGASDQDADPMEKYADLVLAGLRIEPVKDSNLVSISYGSRDPAFSAQVANAVAEAYIDFTVTSQFDTTREASDFLSGRTADLRAEVQELEQRIQLYREQKRILPGPGDRDFASKGVSDIQELYLAARARRIEAEAKRNGARDSAPSSLPGVLSSNTIHSLEGELNTMEIRRSELLRTFKPGWPEVQDLTRKIEGTRNRLDEEIERLARSELAGREAEYQVALGEEKKLEGLLEEQRTAAQRASRDSIEYASLQSELERKRAVLESLIQRQNETAVSSQLRDMGSGNARIVDRALPPRRPVSPRPFIEIPLGLFLGLALGIGAAFAVEGWDNTIRSSEDVERILGLPTLARIPVAGEETDQGAGPRPAREDVDMMSHRSPGSHLAEAFRDLRTSISLSAAGSSPRVMLITSTRPEEGKSTVAMNLAVVISQSGRRVLLVDADLRRPRLHRAFSLGQNQGLSSLLCGKATITEAARETEVPGLSVLPSGPVPPNPAELLDSAAFDSFLVSAQESGYETVILDSAPILTVTDATILAARAEATIIVVESDRTTREEARRAVEKLSQVSSRVLGVVLNSVQELPHSYGYYRYRYGESRPQAEAGGDPRMSLGRRAAERLRRRRSS